jgi:hypothetical protein
LSAFYWITVGGPHTEINMSVNHRQNAAENHMMQNTMRHRKDYANMSMQERQDATVRALEAAIVDVPDRAKTADDIMVEQWGGFADILSGMRKTVAEAQA